MALNKLLCNVGVSNTGYCDCTADPKKITGAFFVPRKKTWTEEEWADMQTQLLAGIMASQAQRIYTVAQFAAVTDSSTDPTFQTLGYGDQEKTQDGKNLWVFQFTKGGLDLSNKLSYFDGQEEKYSVLFFDEKNILFGTKKKDANGNDIVAGIPMNNIIHYPFKINDGSNRTQYRIAFGFDPIYINQRVAYRQVDPAEFLFSELGGLEDVVLKVVSNTAGSLVVSATTDCGESMTESFATELADQTGGKLPWKLYNQLTGAAIAITSIVSNTEAGTFTLAYDPLGANVPANPDKMVVTLNTPALLDTYGVSGYESNVVAFISPVPQLAAPASTSYSAVGPTVLTVGWADVPNAVDYIVERSITPNFVVIAATNTVADPAITLAVTGLVANTQYYFRVKATALDFQDSVWANAGGIKTDV